MHIDKRCQTTLNPYVSYNVIFVVGVSNFICRSVDYPIMGDSILGEGVCFA